MVDDGKSGATGAADPHETAHPTVQPTMQPTLQPTIQPTIQPTVQPTMQPTVQPSDGSEAELGVATADLRSGMIVDGKYRLDRLIGKGGMGHVWLCSHMHMLGDIAVKILIDRLRGRQQSIERFWQEARLMGALGHPNIVRIFDVSPSTADVPYLAMEYLPRESLRHHLKKEKTIEPEEAIRLLDGVLSALIAAHKRGIIHRDIKPENLMFADVRDINTDELRTELKVLDFGASILLDPESQDQATVEGLFGTPYYMSPEQASGTALDHRTDLYAAAVVLYEMISGKVPHEGDGIHALVFSIASDPPIPLRKWMPDLPLSYYKFFDKALAMDADDRFQTAEEMREALRELSGQLARVQRHTELYLKAIPDDDAIPPPPRPGDTGPVRPWREARPIAGGPLEALSDDERARERGRPRGVSAAREIEAAPTVAEEASGRETVSSPSNRLDVVTQEPGGSSLTDLRGASGSSAHTAEVAPIAARGLAIVGAVAAVVGLGVALSLYRARAAEGAVDWGEIGLAWLLPTIAVGGLGIWWLSRQSDARSRRR